MNRTNSKKSARFNSTEILQSSTYDTLQYPPESLPKVLQVSFLLAFAGVATILCILVGFLWQFSRGPERFQVDGVNHYVLTYGPTAVLIWLVAFWRQVDFHVKELTPWNELHNGRARASKSVLLDYVSVLEISAFYSALRNRHFPVIVSTLGFVLLKLATLSSTGLLLVDTYNLQKTTTTTLENKFVTPFIDDNNNTAIFDKSLLYTTYGVLARDLPKPFGLGEGVAYSTFTTDPKLESFANLTVKVDGFVPSFQCRTTDMTAVLPVTNSTDSFPETIIQINNSDCSLRNQDVALYTLNPRMFRCPARQLSGLMRSIDCPNSVFNAEDGAYKLLVMADFRYSQDLNGSDTDVEMSGRIAAKSWSTEIANVTGLICRLSYSMQTVTVNVSKGSAHDVTPATAPNATSMLKLDTFDDDDLDRLFRGSLSASDEILGDRTEEGYALEYPDPMFKMMASVSGGTYEGLLDRDTMARAANKVSAQLAAQVAHQYLRHNESVPIAMQTISPAIRLGVSTLSARVVLTSLGSVVGLCLCLILLLRGCAMGLNQGPLMCAASLIDHDSAIAHDLLESRTCTEKQLQEALHDVDVYTVRNQSGRTDLCLSKSPVFSACDWNGQPWWNPFTVSPIILVILFSLTLATIIVLEVLQHISNENHGFVVLSFDGRTETVFTHYLPALYFLLLTSLYNCMDFNATLLSPFQNMRTSAPIRELRGQHQLGIIPVLAWFQSLRKRSWGTLCSSSAALIGSVLTIVISGLYEVETSYSALSVSVVARDSFAPEWTNSGLYDSGASLVSSLTENLNFTYPPGTYDEIAFPSLQIQESPGKVDNSSITLDVPSWRAHLQCEELPRTQFGVISSSSRIQNSVTVNGSYSLPADCIRGGSNGSNADLDFIQSFPFPTIQNSTYLGKLLDLHVGPYDPIEGSVQGERMPSAMNDNPLGCPSIVLIYGYVELSASTPAPSGLTDMVTVEICYQQIQNVQTTVNFLSSGFDLDIAHPPQIDEASVEYVSIAGNISRYTNDSSLATNLSFRVQGHLDRTFVVFNNTNNNVFSELSDLGNTVDPFFQGVLFGRTPVPFTSLKQQDENQKSQIKQGILSFYRRYMAQAISLNMRVTTNSSQHNTSALIPEGQTSFTANAPTAVITKRIMQHEPSKLVLQIMLAFMLICGIFTASTVQMHNVLPACANPCTIWGQMSLWVGSSIYETSGDESRKSSGEGEIWSCAVGMGWEGCSRR